MEGILMILPIRIWPPIMNIPMNGRWMTGYLMTIIRPTNEVPIIISDINQGNQLTAKRWGYNPTWSKQTLINVKSETVDEKKTFKSSFLQRRCLIPSSGFFEMEWG